MEMTPANYFLELTDYRDESRPLNFIESYYSEMCDVNVITSVGFGPGPLRRHPDESMFQHRGPYMFYFASVPRRLFPFNNPGNCFFLFHTFFSLKLVDFMVHFEYICLANRKIERLPLVYSVKFARTLTKIV